MGAELGLPDGWHEEPYVPERDEAPSFYTDSEHDCDGVHEGEDAPDDSSTIRGGAGRASDRGWGPGWPNCQHGNIVTIVRSDGVRLPVHREIKVLVALLCDETERRGYNLVPGWCWGFACRAIRGSSSPSNHSWGLAVDLNAPTNPMTSPLKTDMPGWMPEMWNSYGFRWGGDYSGRRDAMHYEFLGTPGEAKQMTAKAQASLGGKDWFDMATKDELREVVREEIDRVMDGLFSKSPEKAKAASGRGDSALNLLVENRNHLRKLIGDTAPNTDDA